MATAKAAIVKEGELSKQGGFMKNWKKRWFALLPDSIAYFDQKGGKIKGGILLETIKAVRVASEHECKKPHCLAVETSVGRTYLFLAADNGDMASWLESIQAVCTKLVASNAAEGTSTSSSVGSVGTLYTAAVSLNGISVWSCLESSGLKYDLQLIDFAAGGHLKPEFIEMNPQHQVPTFKGADGFCVFESNVILRYICNKHSTEAAKFHPEKPSVRALVDMALDFRLSTLHPPLSKVAYPYLKFLPEDEAAQKAAFDTLIEKNEGLKDGCLSILENHFLKNRKFIAGEEVSIADFSIRAMLKLADATKGKQFEIKLSERLQKYTEDVDANSKFTNVTRQYDGYINMLNGVPVVDVVEEQAVVTSEGPAEVLAKIKQVKASHPGNRACKHFDEEYYNGLFSDEEKAALLQCINSGVVNADSGMGTYAMQPSDYDRFKPFFSKVLADYHGVAEDAKHTNDWSLEGVEGLPEGGKLDLAALGLPELSMRVRVGRNLKEFPLPGAMTKEDRIAMESKMCVAFEKLTAMPEYGGGYNSLTPDHTNFVDTAAYQKLVDDHIMFKDMAADTYLAAAGIASDWPHGRGCYVSEDRGFIIWVGEEDHLRIMCMQKGAVLNDVFDRLKAALDVVNSIEGLEFAMSEDYGVVTSCPTNLGTGMRASVHIPIPNLTKDGTDAKAKEICKPLGLSVRGTGGEHTPIGADGTCDISPSARFCITEAQIITALYNGLKLLKEKEEEAK
eukprot:m.230238 g.230238  ORF g.230238 m.230238 type:complete len:734 (+) comp33576_c0_seq1:104-2305(+)